MKMDREVSRRNFLKGALLAVPGFMAVMSAGQSFAGAALKWVADNDPTAKALKYVADASKAKGRVDKMGVKAAEQKCSNCMFYAKQGEIGGKEAGKCTMIATGSVAAAGWCASWTKKA